MFGVRRGLSLFVLVSIFLSILPFSRGVNAQELVASEDVGGGSSVFVFRESRKKSQARSGAGRLMLGEGVGGGPTARARSARSNTQIATAAQKRRADAIAARKKVLAAAAKRNALSNTLTAKAEGFLDNNQTDLAITNFRDALVKNPKNSRASDGLSNALMAKGIEVAGDTNELAALTFFNEVVKLDKQNEIAYAKIGAIYDAKGQKDQATANYEKAVAINPAFSSLYPPLGLLYIDAGEIAKAEGALKKADAASVDTVDTRLLRGLVFFKNNQNPAALAAFEQVLALDSRMAAALYYKGQVFDRMNQQDQAIAAYKQTLEINPRFGPAAFDLGVDYYNAGDYNNAAVAYQTAINIDPANAQAHANLGSTYRQLDRCSDANPEYKLASNTIKTADLYSEWGYCLGRANQWDDSVATLKTASEMSPTAIDNSNVGWAYYNAGNSQAGAKNETAAKANYDQAKSYSQKAVDQDPKLQSAYLNLGSTHNKLGEFQLAVGVLKTVLGMNNNWLIATNQLGVGYQGMNDYVNAIATFKQAVNIDGNNTFSLFNLGSSYSASGNKKEAKKINDKLKKLDPKLAAALDNVIAGKIIDATKQKIEQKIKVPKLPF
ncbi:MAG: tetratricopeptide repeat protein [Pyrinomonadaceae bacterium]